MSLLALLGTIPVLGLTAPVDSQDIICHGKDCYPKIFEATDEFQVVREDQVIPKGLHVRMDFNTGLKEAKLYDGIDDPNLQAIEVFSDVSDDTQVAEEAFPSPAEGHPYLQPKSQHVLKPEKAADQGAIRPPPSGPDGAGFQRDTNTIISVSTSDDDEALLPALENLEDLSHDIYWGLRLGQDGKVVHKLNTFVATNSLPEKIRAAAALLLGTAIQNNPAALNAALSHFYNDDYPTGPLETVMLALLHEQVPTLTIKLIYLLSELCQDHAQLTRFIRLDGLHTLRDLYDASLANKDAKDRLRQKISNFVLDHFLIEESLQHLTTLDSTLKDHENGDDSWVVLSEEDLSMPVSSQENPLDMRSTALIKWCEPFSTSLAGWGSSSSLRSESRTAREHVTEASVALDQRLQKLYGCTCDSLSKCPRSR
ncbi:MAG: hypothetical protein GOMPHAMPRED_002519 [Gomphillus americanus]|uniref:Nucleotide exchange factor SIL1 n=1 Tax=Gomphillus americanus TaxID=1940652 RepID=A0A8H3IKK5_9LECA|nr:MAG: hypothetical protein GOMPHAMPRED_002519 [Gomphillus americanus]